jgi:deferrochelatase/peroxidase EfeB
MRATRGTLALHWMLGGYNRRTRAARGEAGKRNLMGFVDGTSNLDPSDDAVMDRYVWVQPGDDEPAWTVGGAYHVVRVIRMLVEFWTAPACPSRSRSSAGARNPVHRSAVRSRPTSPITPPTSTAT